MTKSLPSYRCATPRQRGAAAVEFAAVAIVFFMMLFGAIEMGRLLWTWNAAAEATRLGARMAVVCSMNESNIVTRMRQRLPYLASNNVSIVYAPPGCTEADCDLVRVTITGYSHQTIIPGINLLPVMPPFQTTLTKEFMQSSGNPVCGNP